MSINENTVYFALNFISQYARTLAYTFVHQNALIFRICNNENDYINILQQKHLDKDN